MNELVEIARDFAVKHIIIKMTVIVKQATYAKKSALLHLIATKEAFYVKKSLAMKVNINV